MRFRFRDKVLKRLYSDKNFGGGFSNEVVKAYRKRMALVRAAPDERDFYAMKSLHYEKLSGDRKSQRSMRLNDQWRLILEIEETAAGRTATIVAIEDYH